ncbi:hypothetical protein [Pseudomonas sp. EpS/L25]|uniref:hypothetical protein n=1 Tax=Pseudomonas sp. EpS/L25 TaxID=1749078 RepID=UPI000743814F|nr:hypothetical protein [Pseudomonas sp. EpS/L25]KUM44738.1 hypothetical protein AR540_23725 [Pseudomonas sp. EpS/L25]
MSIQPWAAIDDLRPAVALVILHGGLDAAVTADLRAGLPSCSELPVLPLEDVAALHEDWTTRGPHSRAASLLGRLGSDCLLLVVEPDGTHELEWLGSVAGQRLLHFAAGAGTPPSELIARLQALRRERLLAVLPL